MKRSRRPLGVASLAWLGVACAPASEPGTEPTSAPGASAPASAAVTRASTEVTTATPSAAPDAPVASAEKVETSWLGVPIDRSVHFTERVSFGATSFGLPTGFRTHHLDNGMSESSIGVMAFHPAPGRGVSSLGGTPKDAILMLVTHNAVHDLLLEQAAGTFLGLSAGVSDEVWEPATRVTVGPPATDAELLRGKGKHRLREVDLLQLRLKSPSKSGHGSSRLLIGVIEIDASPEVRAQFLAAFASLTPSD